MTARSGRSIARGRSRVRRERDKGEICAEAGSVARCAPFADAANAPCTVPRGALPAAGLGRMDAPFRIYFSAPGGHMRVHSYRAVCEVREVVGAAGSNPTYPPFPSPGQVPTGGGPGQRRDRLRRATPRTTEIARRLAQKGSFSSCIVLRALVAVAGRATTALLLLLLLLLLRFFVAFSLSTCYVV